jgi:hypothetical protein
MNAPSLLVTHHCVPVGRRALHQLRASLERDTGLQSATYLQEAGFAGGEEVFNAYPGSRPRTASTTPANSTAIISAR